MSSANQWLCKPAAMLIKSYALFQAAYMLRLGGCKLNPFIGGRATLEDILAADSQAVK